MTLGYVSNDEVNRDCFRHMADTFNIRHQLLDLRDDLMDHGLNGLVIDLDSWPPEDRERLLAQVVDRRHPLPVVIHSYQLDSQPRIDHFRRRGVVVLPRLSPAVFEMILGDDEVDAA